MRCSLYWSIKSSECTNCLTAKNIYRWFASVFFYHSLSKSSSILISVPEKKNLCTTIEKERRKKYQRKKGTSRASAHTLSASQIYVCTKWNQHHLCLSIVSVLLCVRMLFPSHPLLLLLVFFVIILSSAAAAAAAAAPSSAFCFRLMPCIAFCIYRKHQWTVVRISFHAEQAQRVESYHQITHSLFLRVYLSLLPSPFVFFSLFHTHPRLWLLSFH